MDCIFCKIINGELPSYTIYEDETVKVFLNINPSTNGHCLLIPKKHVVTIEEIDDNLMVHMLSVIKKVYPTLKDKLKCEGLTISQNNDYGQEVKHFHIHLTPRYTNDEHDNTFNKEILNNIEDVYNTIKG